MNMVRKTGLAAALICGFAAVVAMLITLAPGSTSDHYELVLALCGGALFFASPYAIIPARKEETGKRDRLELLGELCASAFYACVLIAISVMGFEYILALFQPSADSASGAIPLGPLVFFAGFVFSLIVHVLATVWVLVELPGSPTV